MDCVGVGADHVDADHAGVGVDADHVDADHAGVGVDADHAGVGADNMHRANTAAAA